MLKVNSSCLPHIMGPGLRNIWMILRIPRDTYPGVIITRIINQFQDINIIFDSINILIVYQ